MSIKPLVEILIPTYNRCESLLRAIDSAKSQTYANISILVSNNGSTDGTDQFLRNSGVRHVSHLSNMGALANFNFLWSSSKAEYRLFLADDDWIDEDYVTQCIDHAMHSSCSQVAGQAIHYVNERVVGRDSSFELLDRAPLKRLRTFCHSVATSNGFFYGVRHHANYFFAVDNGSDFCDTYFSILNGKSAVIPSTNLHRDFSNWHGDALVASSNNVYREILVDNQLIPMHSVLSFFSVASAVRAYLRSDWSLACLCASIAADEKISLDTMFISEYLKNSRNPLAILNKEKFSDDRSDLQLANGWLKAVHGLLCLSPELPGTSLLSTMRLCEFLGVSRIQMIDINTLWSELLTSPSRARVLMLRSLYNACIDVGNEN